MPPYSELLDLLDLRAQASEAKITKPYKYRKTMPPVKPVHFLSTVGELQYKWKY